MYIIAGFDSGEVIVNYVSKALSLISSLLIVISFYKFKELRSLESTFIKNHSICFVVKNVCGLISAYNGSILSITDLCDVLAVLNSGTTTAAFLWSLVLARQLFRVRFQHLMKSDGPTDEKRILRNANIFVWSITAVLYIIVLAYDNYYTPALGATSVGSCLIRFDSFFIWPLIYIPGLFALTFELVAFVAIRRMNPPSFLFYALGFKRAPLELTSNATPRFIAHEMIETSYHNMSSPFSSSSSFPPSSPRSPPAASDKSYFIWPLLIDSFLIILSIVTSINLRFFDSSLPMRIVYGFAFHSFGISDLLFWQLKESVAQPQSMDEVLLSSITVPFFLKFAQKQLAPEGLMFWTEATAFHAITDARQRMLTAIQITEKYVYDSAERCVNISHSARTIVTSEMDDVKELASLRRCSPVDLPLEVPTRFFDRILHEVYYSLNSDLYPRFQTSPEWDQMISEIQRSKALGGKSVLSRLWQSFAWFVKRRIFDNFCLPIWSRSSDTKGRYSIASSRIPNTRRHHSIMTASGRGVTRQQSVSEVLRREKSSLGMR